MLLPVKSTVCFRNSIIIAVRESLTIASYYEQRHSETSLGAPVDVRQMHVLDFYENRAIKLEKERGQSGMAK